MPIRLQAYERMALFLERISIPSLVVRVRPKSADKNAYEQLLIRTIENEFDHNLSQQIYMSDDCWNIIKAAKNATIQSIRKAGMSESDSADKLREDILNETMEKQSPSATALAFVKKEIGEIW
jgi:CMP-N-acetylneuraminic acid synthetase